MENNIKIDVLYKEYTRLNQRLDNLIDGSLEDFKFLGFIWPVLLSFGTLIVSDKFPIIQTENSIEIGFGIFLAILLVVGIIAFRDFLKLSLINYHIYLIMGYESDISKLINEGAVTFKNIENWNSKFVRNHFKLYVSFTLITILPLMIIPTLVLYQVEEETKYWLVYFIAALIIYLLHFWTANNFLRKPMKKLTVSNKT